MPLSIRPVNASLTHDTDMLIPMKMDPYVVITLGAQRQRTQMCRNGGKNPYWNQTLYFNNASNAQVMQIEVWDKDYLTKDDLVGAGQLNIAAFSDGTWRQQAVSLFYKNRSAGQIMLEINSTGMYGMANGMAMNGNSMMGNVGMNMMPQGPQVPMVNPLYGSNAGNNGLYGSNVSVPMNGGNPLYGSNVVPVNVGGPNPFARPISPIAPMGTMNVTPMNMGMGTMNMGMAPMNTMNTMNTMNMNMRPISPMAVAPISPMQGRPISPMVMQNVSAVNMMTNRPISPMMNPMSMNQMPIAVGPMNGMSNQWYPTYNRY